MDDLPQARSTFVTAVAWVFIVLAGFAVLVCLVQSITAAMMFPHGVTQQMASQADAHLRDFARVLLGHVQWIFMGLLLVFAATLAAAIALLRRHRKARVMFVGLMWLGIVWNIASAVLIYYFEPIVPDMIAPPPSPSSLAFSILRNVVFVFGLCLSIACIGLFSWIVRRFNSAEIRREFR